MQLTFATRAPWCVSFNMLCISTSPSLLRRFQVPQYGPKNLTGKKTCIHLNSALFCFYQLHCKSIIIASHVSEQAERGNREQYQSGSSPPETEITVAERKRDFVIQHSQMFRHQCSYYSPLKHLELHKGGLLERKVYLSFNFLPHFLRGTVHGHAE